MLRRTPVTVMFALVIVAIAQFAHYLPILPERIAVHFGAGGADGWGDARTFVIVYGAVEAAIVLMALLVAAILERAPASSFNIPNRDHWLAPDRRPATVAYMTEQFLWLECLTLAFLIAVAQIIFRANLRGTPPELPRDFWLTLVAFVAGVAWVAARLVRRFSHAPPADRPSER